jgi:hypothetical protein
MKAHDRKRRTREHVIADLGVNYVERQVLLAGYVADRVMNDYGIDLEINTFNGRGEVEQGKILVQVKATDKLKVRADSTIVCRIERKDLVAWLAHPFPVMLILYDAVKDIAFWLYAQSYFRKREDFNLFLAGRTITVELSAANVLKPSSVIRFARFRDRVLGQMDEVVHDEDKDDPVR